MKNRKTVIVAFLLVAALMLGVGYAALTDTLTINGYVTVTTENATDAFDEDVKFTSVANVSTNVTAIIDTDTDSTSDTGKITINAGALEGKGDKVSATYTITNSGDLTATVAVPDITIADGYSDDFSVTTDWTAAKTVAAGGNTTVTVTIELLKTPVAALDNVTFGLSFDVQGTEATT